MTPARTPLITCGELAELIGDPRTAPVVLDVRWTLGGPAGRPEYDAGHIPGARFVDFEVALSAVPRGTGTEPRRTPGGRHPLPDAAAFEEHMRAAGVGDSEVVVTDGGNAMAAARCWWCLRYFGHRAVRVLDGGYRAWVAGGYPVSTVSASPPRGSFVARPGGMPMLDADGAARLARSGTLLDARAGERYRGETEPLDAAAGHIPGARSAPAAGSLDSQGTYVPPERLRSQLGAEVAGTSVGCYCGSGVSAAVQVLALATTGVEASLYVGSWSDWVADPARPVARGPEPG